VFSSLLFTTIPWEISDNDFWAQWLDEEWTSQCEGSVIVVLYYRWSYQFSIALVFGAPSGLSRETYYDKYLLHFYPNQQSHFHIHTAFAVKVRRKVEIQETRFVKIIDDIYWLAPLLAPSILATGCVSNTMLCSPSFLEFCFRHWLICTKVVKHQKVSWHSHRLV
jgi:hypothetical protein